MPNDTFWNNPPWANGQGGYQMGLIPVEPRRWCERAITQTEQAAKLALLQTRPTTVVQATDSSVQAQQLLADHIADHAERAQSMARAKTLLNQLNSTINNHPLILAALSVPEDLCLLQCEGSRYKLVAGCVTAPSYWRLRDKIGLEMAAVHSNVPGLNDALEERMNAFFERLPAGRCLLRRNWFLHDSSARFQPDPEPERDAPITTAAAAAMLTVRSETQTLRRLSAEVIAFTIDVSCYALEEVSNYPAAARTLRDALASRNTAERSAANQDNYEAGVLALLEQSCQ